MQMVPTGQIGKLLDREQEARFMDKGERNLCFIA